MSTLTVTNISNGSVTTATANVVSGCAKAWVNFNATSGSAVVRASYNVSSVTYNSTGNYVVNFTSALSDANYAMLGTAYYGGVVAGSVGVITPTTTTCTIQTVRTDNMSAVNMLYTCVGFFR